MKVVKYSSSTCIKCRALQNEWEKIKENHKDWDFEEISIDNNPDAVNEIVNAGFQALPIIKFDNGTPIYTDKILGAKDFEEFISVPF